MATENTPKTLQQAVEYFSDEARCHAYAVAMRWPNGIACPTCGSLNVVQFEAKAQSKATKKNPNPPVRVRRLFQCRENHLAPQFTIKTASIFEDSPISLKSWLLAMWFVSNCKNGVSSYEVHRAIGITQKSAWFVLQRLRLAMQSEDGGKLGGDVEADETYIGGRARFMHKAKRERVQRGRGASKVAVMGLLERNTGDKASRVKLKIVRSIKRGAIQAEVRANVEAGANLYTDALASYSGLDKEYVHGVIDHAEAYVRENVHTNGMENFWSLLKRTIKGTYVSVEPFHLFRYLDEQAFRFNERGGTDADRFEQTLRQVVNRRLTYKGLIAKEATA